MNVENIRAVARRLRSPSMEGHFDITTILSADPLKRDLPNGQIIHECGTVVCLCGTVLAVAYPTAVHSDSEPYDGKSSYQAAADWMGITYSQAERLFEPPGYQRGNHTREQAAIVCEYLIETSQVDWSVAP